jgi:hypothetical protein
VSELLQNPPVQVIAMKSPFQGTRRQNSARLVRSSVRRRVSLVVEALEDRATPATMIAASFVDSSIYEFDTATGALLKTLIPPGSPLSPTLNGPAGLAIGPDQSLYISSQANDTILRYDLVNDRLSTFVDAATLDAIADANGATVFGPAGLEFGPDGNLYVVMSGGQGGANPGGVVRLDIHTDAVGVHYSGTSYTLANTLVQPTSLTFGPDGDLYVSNTFAGSVIEFDDPLVKFASTSPFTTFIAPGSAGLGAPTGIAFGPDGGFYVVDVGAQGPQFQGNVFRFNGDGSGGAAITPHTTFGEPGNLQFQFPSDILFDNQGHFLTANIGNPGVPIPGTINKYNANGTFVATVAAEAIQPQLGPFFGPAQLVLLPERPVIVGSFVDSTIYKNNPVTGALIETIVPLGGFDSPTLNGPSGMTIGVDQRLYVSSQTNDVIIRYVDQGSGPWSPVEVIDAGTLAAAAALLGSTHAGPSGLEFGPDGNLYVVLNGDQGAPAGGGVVRFDMNYSPVNGISYAGTFHVLVAGLTMPTSLTFGVGVDAGSLYVSNSFARSVIKVANATTTPTPGNTLPFTTFIAPGTGGLDTPTGIAWGPDGRFYVVDVGASTFQGNVFRFTADGTSGAAITPTGPGAPGNLLFQFPSDIYFTSEGHFLTANIGNPTVPIPGTVNRYENNGSFVATIASTAQVPGYGPFYGPAQFSAAPVHLKSTTSILGNVVPSAPAAGQLASWTVTVAPNGPIGLTANGDVTFSLDGGAGVTQTLAFGQTTFITGPLTLGTHTIRATYSGDNDFFPTVREITFEVVAPVAPTVTSVTPFLGPTTGAFIVDILGTGFNYSAAQTSATFGGVPGTGVVVVSATHLQVVAPANPVGFANVVVATPAGTSTSSGTLGTDRIEYAVAPVLLSTVLNGNDPQLLGLPPATANQRSMVRSFRLTFDVPVTLAADAVAISLHNPLAPIPGTVPTLTLLNAVGNASANTVWNVTFSGTSVVGGSIVDGEYDLTIDPLKVTAANGLHLTTAPSPLTFYRLLGDSDGNRTVNTLDVVNIRREANTTSASPGYQWLYDSDWNGTINNIDIIAFRRNTGKAI